MEKVEFVEKVEDAKKSQVLFENRYSRKGNRVCKTDHSGKFATQEKVLKASKR